MFKLQPLLNLGTGQALLIALCTITVLSVGIIFLEWVPHLALLSALVLLVLFGLLRRLTYTQMQQQMATAVASSIAAVYLFFFIGLLVTALMMCGAIPSLMYYGFNLISPQYFYVSAFVITAIIGVAIGSSLTTCATLGVAFISMASVFGADLAVTAGAIVSGAFFGDKMSPLSDTTSIAASVVGIDLFEHIGNMAYTTIPASILSIILFYFMPAPAAMDNLDGVLVFKAQLLQTGLIHGYALLPFVVLILLVARRVSAIPAMVVTIFSALVITYCHSSPTLQQLGGYFFSGYTSPQDLGEVSRLVSRGGIQSMFFTQTIVVLAMSLGGLLYALGIVPSLLATMQSFLISAGRATFTVAATAVGINVLVGEQYLSLLLAGETFKPAYERLNLHPRNLSRTLEDAGTVINPLVPWSVCGVFIAHSLGVSVWGYVPYAFFCYLSLLLTLIFGFSGFTISKKSP